MDSASFITTYDFRKNYHLSLLLQSCVAEIYPEFPSKISETPHSFLLRFTTSPSGKDKGTNYRFPRLPQTRRTFATLYTPPQEFNEKNMQ